MKIEIMNQISKNDFVKAIRYFRRNYDRRTKRIIYSSLTGALIFLISSIIEIRQIVIQVTQSVSYFSYLRYTFELIINNKVYFIYLLFIIFCSFFMFYRFFNYPNFEQKKWANKVENKKIFLPKKIIFTDDGIKVSFGETDQSSTFFGWHNFINVFNHDDYLILNNTSSSVLIIKKSQIEASKLIQINELIESKNIKKFS
ncbi:MAG: hypothetical protein LKF42_03630 [Streptococcaceae bacterium]|jgi:hypothetical protein|nr:hypothetical protein [Streptococcaceae bacterium]MCH4176915.1 hypothetical protein [Streptococcaceae bacterium]